MPKYEIVDWYYRTFENKPDIWKNKENLKNAILSKDDKGTAKSWINKSDWYTDINKGDRSTQTSLKERVDTANENYISQLRADIKKANTEDQLNKLTIDKEYEQETQDIAEGQIGERIEEVLGEDIERIREIINSLNKSKDINPENFSNPDRIDSTISEIEGLMEEAGSTGEVRREYGGEIANQLSSAKAEAAEKVYDLKQRKEVLQSE